VTRYYNDGFDVLFETNGTGSLTRSYTHGARIDEILSSSDSKARLSDGLGSTRTLTDAAGQQTASYIYDVFGEVRSETGTKENDYLFTGRDLDRDLGIYYYRNRWYDPSVGRFITKDPIGLRGGINQYAYVENNPVNYRDPSGLISAEAVLFAIGVAGALKLAYELNKYADNFKRKVDIICETKKFVPDGDPDDPYNTPIIRLNKQIRSKEFQELVSDGVKIAGESYGN